MKLSCRPPPVYCSRFLHNRDSFAVVDHRGRRPRALTSVALEEQARGFFTQQHGDNVVYEFFRVRAEQANK